MEQVFGSGAIGLRAFSGIGAKDRMRARCRLRGFSHGIWGCREGKIQPFARARRIPVRVVWILPNPDRRVKTMAKQPLRAKKLSPVSAVSRTANESCRIRASVHLVLLKGFCFV